MLPRFVHFKLSASIISNYLSNDTPIAALPAVHEASKNLINKASFVIASA